MSMADVDEIVTDDESLRSPHNFHLNVMARLGFPIFIAWICWIYLVLIK